MSNKQEDKVVRTDISIEGNTARFQLAAHGAINGLYTGEFIFRCYISPTQKIMANREYREMLGANATLAPQHESFLAYALTQLKYRIISAPPFWTSTLQINNVAGDVEDDDIIQKVLEAAIDAEVLYKQVQEEKKLSLLKKATEQAQKIIDGKKDGDDIDEDEDFVDDIDEDEEVAQYVEEEKAKRKGRKKKS